MASDTPSISLSKAPQIQGSSNPPSSKSRLGGTVRDILVVGKDIAIAALGITAAIIVVAKPIFVHYASGAGKVHVVGKLLFGLLLGHPAVWPVALLVATGAAVYFGYKYYQSKKAENVAPSKIKENAPLSIANSRPRNKAKSTNFDFRKSLGLKAEQRDEDSVEGTLGMIGGDDEQIPLKKSTTASPSSSLLEKKEEKKVKSTNPTAAPQPSSLPGSRSRKWTGLQSFEKMTEGASYGKIDFNGASED